MTSDVQTRRTSEYAATQRPATPVAERPARALRGLRMLTLGLAVLAAGIVVLWLAGRQAGDAATGLVWLGVILVVCGAGVLGA
jgi:hypothetical protein